MNLAEVVERGDLDELVRAVDGLSEARAWTDLVELRDRCDRAVERGHQLWPAAQLAEYRIALDAPVELAAAMLVERVRRFGLGPISEVAAQHHRWADLVAHAPAGPVGAMCAYERVVRGEDLRSMAIEPAVLELPLALCDWEPQYALASYRPDRAEFPAPDMATFADPVSLVASVDTTDDLAVCSALIDVADGWTTSSRGRARAAAVVGDHWSAIAAVGSSRVRIAELEPAAALAHLAWTAASGGALGRRRGAATGRLDAWIASAALAGLDDWPVAADELGAAIAELRWYAFDDLDAPVTGWSLRLAIEDPAEELAWAVVATDRDVDTEHDPQPKEHRNDG